MKTPVISGLLFLIVLGSWLGTGWENRTALTEPDPAAAAGGAAMRPPNPSYDRSIIGSGNAESRLNALPDAPPVVPLAIIGRRRPC